MYPRILRDADELLIDDANELVRTALEQVQETYAQLAQIVMVCGENTADDNKLCVLIAKAQAANNKMLSCLRHPVRWWAMSIAHREYRIANTYERITAAQNLLDRLMDDARLLSNEHGIAMRYRYIERCIDNLSVVREDFEKNVLKIKPTAALDRAYEKDLS